MNSGPESPRDVRRIAVLGAGTMGHGIAQVAAMAGYEVVLVDVAEKALEQARDRIRSNLDAGVERGKVEPRVRDRAVRAIRTTTRTRDAGDADLVVEAVPEDLDLKCRIFTELEAIVSGDTILATNTSSLSVTRIAESARAPERVLGLHFFNPVHIMKLVEIVRTPHTAPAVIETARHAVQTMGKTPILVKDSPGFASSRLGVVLGLEAMRMLEEGVAGAEDIDTAMELGYRHPMGPLRLSDLIGLDVRLAIAEYLYGETGAERFRPPEILRRKVAAGKLGKKTGEGFYRWDAATGGPGDEAEQADNSGAQNPH